MGLKLGKRLELCGEGNTGFGFEDGAGFGPGTWNRGVPGCGIYKGPHQDWDVKLVLWLDTDS